MHSGTSAPTLSQQGSLANNDGGVLFYLLSILQSTNDKLADGFGFRANPIFETIILDLLHQIMGQ